MRNRQWTRLPHCSKKGLRKISRLFRYLFFISLFFLCPLFSIEAGLHVDVLCDEETITLDIRLHDMPTEEILKSFEKGYRGEINFNIKLYRKTEGLFSFLGDRLVQEVNLTREAGWDMFDRVFYFTEESGGRHAFKEKQIFFSKLFSVHNLRLSVEFDDDRSYYLLVNGQINPVKLTAPISIIQLVRPEGRYTTPWKRVPVRPDEEGGR